MSVTAVTASGNAVFDFSQCPSPYVVWAAFRDGNGPWTRVTPTAKVFRFTINSPLAAFAYVVQQNSPSTTGIGGNIAASSCTEGVRVLQVSASGAN